MTKVQWKPLLISLLISLGTGAVSALVTPGTMEKYNTLYKPPLSPPGWVFPVVWTILFLLMGIAAYLVYVSDSLMKNQALSIYVKQLAVNAAWSILFFTFDAYLLAFLWLMLLWVLVFFTAKQFYAINPAAGKLMVPYLLWLTFAAYLNLAIVIHYAA